MKKIITFFAFLVLISCTGVEPEDSITRFVYQNNSEHIIELNVYNAILPGSIVRDFTFTIHSESKLELEYINDYIGSPFGGVADSSVVIFNNEKQITYRNKESHPDNNILRLESYQFKSLSENLGEYHYTVTEKDYNNAVPIEE